MITLQQLRVEIADEARWCTPRSGQPEVLSISTDGKTYTFFLRFTKAILSSVQLYFGTINNAAPQLPAYELIPATHVTYPWVASLDGNNQPIVTFTAAAPPPLKIVAARYLMTAFSDNDLNTYLKAPGNIRSADQYTLKAVHYDIIPAILANRDAMMVTRSGDITQDPSNWARMQSDLRKQLMLDLAAEPVGTGASLGIGGYSNAPYLN